MTFLITTRASVAACALIVAAPTAFRASSPAPERLWSPTGSQEVYGLSPDGKLVGYINWDTGNLMIHDLATGTDRDLTKKGSYKDSGDEANSALFSPDGRTVAYEWWDGKARVDEVRVVGVDGTGIKTLYRGAPGVSLWPSSWTPDGKSILTLVETSAHRDITVIPATGGEPKVVKSFGPNNRNMATAISPDGKYVAVAIPAPIRAATSRSCR